MVHQDSSDYQDVSPCECSGDHPALCCGEESRDQDEPTIAGSMMHSEYPERLSAHAQVSRFSEERYHTPLCGYAFSFKNISQHNLAGASVRHRIANALELLSSSLVMGTIARQKSHRPRRAFHSISHASRVWFLGGLVFVASQWRSLRFCSAERGTVIARLGS